MNQEIIATIMLFGILIFLMVIRFPIAFALGISAVTTALYLDISLFNLYQKMTIGLNSFTFMAVPFFIIMAQIMTDGDITNRLMKFCNILLGRIRGGTAMMNVLVSMLFGGISGSSAADVSSIGSMLIPAMVNEGYDEGYSVAVTVTSSVQGVIIPPSQNLLFYAIASASGISISRLFIAGYIPGILLGIGLMVPTYVIAVKRKYPLGEKRTLRENLRVVVDALLGLGAIIVVIGGTTTGVCSATEAAGIAAVYALVITTCVYRNMSFKMLVEGMKKCLPTLAMAMAIIASSSAFSYILSYLKIPQNLTNFLLSVTDNRVILTLLLLLLMLLLGCFMDMGILILLLTPILFPVAVGGLGFDPYHFGIVLVLAFGIGLCTPPVGTSLFIGCSIAKTPIEKVTKDFLPFYGIMVILLLVLTFVPAFSTWLPSVLGV